MYRNVGVSNGICLRTSRPPIPLPTLGFSSNLNQPGPKGHSECHPARSGTGISGKVLPA